MSDDHVIMEIGILKGQMESVRETLQDYSEKFDKLSSTIADLRTDVHELKASYEDQHERKQQQYINKNENRRFKTNHIILILSAIIGASVGSIVTTLITFLKG